MNWSLSESELALFAAAHYPLTNHPLKRVAVNRALFDIMEQMVLFYMTIKEF